MPRRISITSRKPVVVTIAARGKVRVIRAFVATVEPCEKTVTSRRSTSAARAHAVDHRVDRVGRRRRHLRHRDRAGVLVEHADVGERAADVDWRPRRTARASQLVDHEQPGRHRPVIEAPVHVVGRAARSPPRPWRRSCRRTRTRTRSRPRSRSPRGRPRRTPAGPIRARTRRSPSARRRPGRRVPARPRPPAPKTARRTERLHGLPPDSSSDRCAPAGRCYRTHGAWFSGG